MKFIYFKNKKTFLNIVKRGSDISGMLSVLSIFFGVNINIAIPSSMFFLLLGILLSILIDIIPKTIDEIKSIIMEYDDDIDSLMTIKDDIESCISLSTSRTRTTLHLPTNI